MKKGLGFIVVVLLMMTFLLSGCIEDSADTVLKKQTEKAMKEMNSQVGMPAIVNFQERKLAKMIFELRDKTDLVCYAYIKSDYQGKLTFIGKCIGFGLPYSVQYTSPMAYKKVLSATWSSMPQADPNGLYMPPGLSATWLMMINPKTGEANPVYIECEIVVSPFPLH